MRTTELVEYFGVYNAQIVGVFLSISTDRDGEFEKQKHSFGLPDSMKSIALLADSVFCLSYDDKVSGIMA